MIQQRTQSRSHAPASAASTPVMARRCGCGRHTIGGGTCSSCQRGATPQRETAPAGKETDSPARGASWARSASARPFTRGGQGGSSAGRSEAAFDDTEPEPNVKKEGGGLGAGIGALGGAAVGAIAGGLIGGVGGAVLGGLIGAGVGALVGWLIGRATGGGINWQSADYAADDAAGASTTVEKPFDVKYDAKEDKGDWKLKVASITGGATIRVHRGGSRDPGSNPPTTEGEAADAVTTMKGYYARGGRGAWHTEAASKAHEEHHYEEWKCTADHYWAIAQPAIEKLSVSKTTQPDKGGAITAMRSGPAGADAIVASFAKISHDYWFTLSDGPSSRPYAAGQRALNPAIRGVQGLASSKGWAVEQGTDNPSSATPCYQPWLPYAP